MNLSSDTSFVSGRPLPYRSLRWLFAALLAAALLYLFLHWPQLRMAFQVMATHEPIEPGASNPPDTALLISLATSLVSLFGLLSTNLMAWRREAREARVAEVQLQQQKLEIERLKLELEKQRRALG